MEGPGQPSTCPRCGKDFDDPPSPSRTDNVTPICSMCGIGESLDALEGEMVPQSEWPWAAAG